MPKRLLLNHFLWLIFFSLSLTSLNAHTQSTPWLINDQHPDAQVRLLLTGETNTDTNTVTAALEVKLTNDWKTYWRSPGEAGIAPSLQWTGSENIADIRWHWPLPERFDLLGIDTLGYKGDTVFPLTLSVNNPDEPVKLKTQLRLSTCTTICVLTDYDINLDFTPSQLTPDSEAIFLVDKAMSTVPELIPATSLNAKSAYWDQNSQQLTVNAYSEQGWQSPDMIIDGQDDLFFSPPQFIIRDNQLQALIKVSSWLEDVSLEQQPVTITLINGQSREQTSEHPLTVISGTPETLVDGQSSSFWMMIAFALLGGFILNLMPCVLPVLGMKLSSLIKASGQNTTVTRQQFLSTTLGILFSFWLLATFIWLLKITGNSIGWGIQFQSPWFIGFMVVITALFGANLFDLFEIRLPSFLSNRIAQAGDNSLAGHFIQGMFATLLATPCSAPFLGTAVAFALSKNTLSLFSIFTALGIGLSLPYILIAIRPALLSWMPKPGVWMVKLRRVLACMLLLTTLWLVSLLAVHLPTFALLLIAIPPALLLTSQLLKGFVPTTNQARVPLFIASIMLALTLVLVGAWSLGMLTAAPKERLPWQPLDEQRIAELVKEGNTVFVDITADWCVTCQANKARVIDRDPVNSQLQANNVVLMKGDWTRASEDVSTYLNKNGRFGVPFNRVYGPGAPEGISLPVILSHDIVINALESASTP